MSIISPVHKLRHAWYRILHAAPGILVTVTGLGLLAITEYYLHGLWYSSLLKALGDATVIAGIIALFVEPAMKRRLLREAAEGIFEHILGFDIEPAIKERLKGIAFGQTLYVRDALHVFEISRLGGGRVRVVCSSTYELRNATASTVRHVPIFASDRADFTEVHEMSMSPTPNHPGFVTAPTRRSDPSDSEIDIWEAQPVEILPHRAGAAPYRMTTRFSCVMPEDFYYNYAPTKPQVGVTIRVVHDDSLVVSVAKPLIASGHGHWYYSGVVMNGERFVVRWHPKSDAAGNSKT